MQKVTGENASLSIRRNCNTPNAQTIIQNVNNCMEIFPYKASILYIIIKFVLDKSEIMNTIEKRDYIHNYLFRLVDRDIDDVYRKVRSIVEQDICLTSAQNDEVDRRVAKHKTGESKSMKWSEVKAQAKSSL